MLQKQSRVGLFLSFPWCDIVFTSGLAQDCGNSSVLSMESPQSCTKPLIWGADHKAWCYRMLANQFQLDMLPGRHYWGYYPSTPSCVLQYLQLIWRSSPVDEIYGCPIFKWEVIWIWILHLVPDHLLYGFLLFRKKKMPLSISHHVWMYITAPTVTWDMNLKALMNDMCPLKLPQPSQPLTDIFKGKQVVWTRSIASSNPWKFSSWSSRRNL